MHLVGMSVVALLPLLAVFGVFGINRATTTATSETLAVRVAHPSVQRFKVRQPLRITVTNTAATALPVIEVALSVPYVFAFSDVALTPSPDHIDGDTYVFELSDIAPGETRTIATEMQAQLYWRHRGSVSWRALDEGGRSLDGGSLEFTTMVWP